MGPRGQDLDRTRTEDMILVYKGKQSGFPESSFGSYEAMGLDGDVCTDRYSRFGAYGFEEDHDDDIPGFIRPPLVSWLEVDWHDLVSLSGKKHRSLQAGEHDELFPPATSLIRAETATSEKA